MAYVSPAKQKRDHDRLLAHKIKQFYSLVPEAEKSGGTMTAEGFLLPRVYYGAPCIVPLPKTGAHDQACSTGLPGQFLHTAELGIESLFALLPRREEPTPPAPVDHGMVRATGQRPRTRTMATRESNLCREDLIPPAPAGPGLLEATVQSAAGRPMDARGLIGGTMADNTGESVDRLLQSLRLLVPMIAPTACINMEVSSRQRDILPAPLLEWWPIPVDGLTNEQTGTLIGTANCALSALNAMYGNVSASCRGFPTAAQRSIQYIAAAKAYRMRARLAHSGASFDYLEALRSVVGDSIEITGAKPAQSCGNFAASSFDLLPCSGLVDPLPSLPQQVSSLVMQESGIFMDMPAGLDKYAGIRRTDKTEYAKLVTLQLRSQKVELAHSVSGGGAVFAVPKKDSTKLREVWHGERVSLCAAKPPKPPYLANPAALQDLETIPSKPYFLSKRDGRCLFDQLLAPPHLRQFFGRPPVLVRDLVEYGGMSLKEVQAHCNTTGLVTMRTVLYPRSRVWPMGFSWSSYIAQSFMLSLCHSAGLSKDKMLALELEAPRQSNEVFGVATDDVLHFCTSAATAKHRMRDLDRAFCRLGATRHEKKDVDQVTDGVAIGIQLDRGLYLAPASSSLCNLLLVIVHLVTVFPQPLVTPLEIAAVLGVAQWFCLLNRSLFSSFYHIYEFVRTEPQNVRIHMSSEAMRELAIIACLAIYFEADLTRSWSEDIFASDASSSFGLGICTAHIGSAEARAIGLRAARLGFYVRPAADPMDEPELERLGLMRRLRIKKSKFHIVLSMRAKYQAHSGALEAAAATAMLRCITRSHSRHRQRTVALIDAQAVLGALVRGRSSAHTLRKEIAKAAALTIAADLVMRYAYTPSESNPADGPSRGRNVAGAVMKGVRKKLKPVRLTPQARAARDFKKAIKKTAAYRMELQ